MQQPLGCARSLMMSLFDELKRRNVIRLAGLYVAGAWLILQVAATVLPIMDAPVWLSRGIVVLLAIGFVPALVFAWAFEITPEGLKRERDVDRSQSIAPQTGRRLDRWIMVLLALALGYFAFDKFALAPQRTAEQTDAAHKAGRSEALVASYGDKSIAVLPFTDMSPGKDQEYLSDGIAEELLNLLARIPELRVISRSSAFSYKGKDVKLAQIAEELKVAHILEGSVRKADERVRITAQLIDARSDTQLWSQTWDREIDDVFAVQDEIAGAVVAQLKVTLLRTAPQVTVTDPKAYALFLQARQLAQQRTREGHERAIELYQQALAIDERYAAAWSGLADMCLRQADLGWRPFEEGYRLARDALGRALAIDPDLAPAHAGLGWIAMSDNADLPAAARHLERALVLEPTNVRIVGNAATLAMALGRLDTAIALYEFSAARDPLNASRHANLGIVYGYAGRNDEAIASFRTALGLSPKYAFAQGAMGMALLAKGEPQAALAEIQKESHDAARSVGLAIAWHALGNTAESDAALAELIRVHHQEWAYNIAYVLAYRGETDPAFVWLDKAVAQRDPGLTDIAIEPLFANLHQDPRWLPFLRKINKAPEQLARIEFDVTLPQ